jgi:hypothetical protein
MDNVIIINTCEHCDAMIDGNKVLCDECYRHWNDPKPLCHECGVILLEEELDLHLCDKCVALD